MTGLFQEYVTIWRLIQGDDVCVRYDGAERFMDGYFLHDKDSVRLPEGGYRRRPLIAIGKRYSTPDDQPSEQADNGQRADLQHELFTLAHEYGHCLSFRGSSPRDAWCAYKSAALHWGQLFAAVPEDGSIPEMLGAGLSADEKGLIMAEEARAWRLGRPFVPDARLAQFDIRAAHDLEVHRFLMGIVPHRPGD